MRFPLSQILLVFPNFQISAFSNVNWYQIITQTRVVYKEAPLRRSLTLAVWSRNGNYPSILVVPAASAFRGISRGKEEEEDLRCVRFTVDDSFPALSKNSKQRVVIYVLIQENKTSAEIRRLFLLQVLLTVNISNAYRWVRKSGDSWRKFGHDNRGAISGRTVTVTRDWNRRKSMNVFQKIEEFLRQP